MAKSYLITVHDDNVTGLQVMKALQKLGCFVEMKDLSRVNARPSVQANIDKACANFKNAIDGKCHNCGFDEGSHRAAQP